MPDLVIIVVNELQINARGNENSAYSLTILHEIQPGYAFVTAPDFKISGEKILSHVLGTGAGLAGKEVYCTSTVSDVRPDTNVTNVRIIVYKDGIKIDDQTFSHEVAVPNQSIVYNTIIKFI